jgi:hypothetical protein
MILAVIFCFARSAARWWKAHEIQIEDFLLWFALISYLAMCGIYLNTMSLLYRILALEAGTMPLWPTVVHDGVTMMKYVFVLQILFWTALWSVKFSLLWMFRRLTLGLPYYTLIWWVITAFNLLSFVGCVIFLMKSCSSMTEWFTFGKACLNHQLLTSNLHTDRLQAVVNRTEMQRPKARVFTILWQSIF